MTAPAHYLAVLKASYDYEPQSEDEIAIKEDQVLYLIERTDEDWWKVKVKGTDEDAEPGLVPAAYVEPAEHKSVVKALYDYEATAPGELSVKEDDVLYAFDAEEDWLLVQTEKDGGKAGFVPVTYVEENTEAGATAAEEEPEPEPEEEEEEQEVTVPSSIANIVVPPSPPRPTAAPYMDPAERVAASHAASNVANDGIKTWAVSEVDKKGKKKKGTLGIGNGSIFFASESDKAPVQKWSTADVDNSYTEKSKHIHIEILGSNPINLHFNAGSKDTAEAIIDKLDTSKQLAKSQASASAVPVEERTASTSSPKPKKNGVSVHFTSAPPSIISPREPEESSEPDDYASSQINQRVDDGNEWANVLYDFSADGEDELSVTEGDRLIVLERDSDDWWKVRDSEGREGVVPAQYVELEKRTSTPATNGDAAKAAAERERAKEEEKLRAREEQERRAEIERKAQAAAAAEAAEAERKRREREREKRAREDAERRSHELQEAEQQRAVRESRPDSSSGSRRRQSEEGATASRPSKSRGSSDGARTAPSPQRVRTWHDRTGQFQVDAEFLGMANGKLRLHKTNGVVIEVPSEKMSAEDLKYVENHQNGAKSREREREKSRKASRALSPVASDDDQPLAERRRSLQPEPKSKPAPPRKSKPVDWFEFFLNAGCDLDDCTRYATSFERDKIDESILPDITQQTMRQLGLREGDIIRVSKHILQKIGSQGMGNSALEEQMRKDEELARRLQEEENVGPKRQTASPGLFSGPGGVLKNNTRRGRPQPSKSTPPASVDLLSITTASEQINREKSPSVSLVASPTSIVQAPARASSVSTTEHRFEDDAWTNRPSSTQPISSTQPAVSVGARAPSAPPKQATPPVSAPPAPPPPPAPTAATAAPTGSTTNSGSNLARTTEDDVFNQLARLAALKPKSPPAVSPSPLSQQMSQLSVSSPTIVSPPPGIQNGLGAGSSPVPIGQLHNQFTGYPQNNGPRGPFAPVPANQGLLQPLIPTSTANTGFVPTRPGSNPPSSFGSPSPQPNFLNSQPTGFVAPQPTGFPGSFGIQPTGFQGGLMSQPTGFQNGIISQPTGFPGAQISQPTGFPASGPPVQQTTSYPGAFGAGPFTGGRAFGPLQPNVTGFNPGFGQISSPPPVPPVPPLPSNANASNSPANVFAQMKSGTFGNDSAPQSSNKYDALRPQPTGWGATTGLPNGGYSGTFY